MTIGQALMAAIYALIALVCAIRGGFDWARGDVFMASFMAAGALVFALATVAVVVA